MFNMEKQRFLKVENDENWVRDTDSGALVRIDKDVDYNSVQRKRKELIDKKIKEQLVQEDINNLKSELSEIKSLLKLLLNEKING